MNYLIIRCVTFSLVLSRIYSKCLTYKQRSIFMAKICVKHVYDYG